MSPTRTLVFALVALFLPLFALAQVFYLSLLLLSSFLTPLIRPITPRQMQLLRHRLSSSLNPLQLRSA